MLGAPERNVWRVIGWEKKRFSQRGRNHPEKKGEGGGFQAAGSGRTRAYAGLKKCLNRKLRGEEPRMVESEVVVADNH